MRHATRLARRAIGPVAAALVLLAAAPSAPAQVGASQDFLTQGYDIQRTGYNPNETILGTGNVAGLHLLWSFDLGDRTNVQPLFASGVLINTQATDVVYIGDRAGNFFAIDANTGLQIWQAFTGTSETFNCGGPFGEDGSPTIDRATNRVYVPGGDGKVYALDLSTGAIITGWPVVVITQTLTEHIYSGLNLWKKRLYVSVSSYCDQPPWEGRVTVIDTSDPTRMKEWLVTGPGRPSGGGIWGPGGVAIDPANSNVYTATGNSLGQSNYLYAEHVVRLTSGLQVVSSNYPGFVPGVDLDWGGTPVLYKAPGCPGQLAVKNKDGELFVYDRDTINDGPRQKILMSQANGTFIGDVAYSPVANMVYVPNGSDGAFLHGLHAFAVQPDCTLSPAWYQPAGPDGVVTPSPTIANGVVYYPDSDGGKVHAYDAVTGTELWNSGSIIGSVLHQSVTVTSGRMFVPCYDNKMRVFGL